MQKIISLLVVLFLLQTGYTQSLEVTRVDPPFWWAGMKNSGLQLMLKGTSLKGADVVANNRKVKITEVRSLESENYLVIDLDLSRAKAGTVEFTLTKGAAETSFSYELHQRENTGGQQGLNSGDVMYLIMPDRFANGNPETDNVNGMSERANRENPGGKHGGDLQGISEHLDYIADLGVTAIWLNPVYENNMKEYSYHGYSITDHYRVDPRYGTMEEYRELVTAAHAKGLKVVKDMIFNHIGLYHFWMEDLPAADWIHQWPSFTQTNYTGAVVTDPYASEYDYKKMVDGWFVPTMPDVNQDNEDVMTYLIQQSIWWIEHTGIDGIRMDTYPYPSRVPMARWVQEVMDEYPEFFIVGETWLHAPSYEGYWQGRKGVGNADGYDSQLQSVSDFPLYYALQNAFGKKEGLYKLYEVLSQDFVYPDASQNKIFLDNHDVDRFFSTIGEHINTYKLALTFLLTTRGIPQFFYGTEILMKGRGDHGIIREDFPGGWPGDERNAFSVKGRTERENEAFDFTKALLNWRKSKRDLFEHGKLVHFIPEGEVYIYSRYTDTDRIIVVLNNNAEARSIDLTRFAELIGENKTGRNVLSGEEVSLESTLDVPGMGAMVIEL